jgi:hypothetical protein
VTPRAVTGRNLGTSTTFSRATSAPVIVTLGSAG